MRSYVVAFLLLFALLIVFACDTTDPKPPEGRVFDHPSNGLQYYYEVPEHNIKIQGMADYCSAVEMLGGGWRIPNITELRYLATDVCQGYLEPNGKCAISEECNDWHECYDYEYCNCSDVILDEDGCYMIISDPEKTCGSFMSNTEVWPVNVPGQEYKWEYYGFFPSNAQIATGYAYEKADVMCVREKP